MKTLRIIAVLAGVLFTHGISMAQEQVKKVEDKVKKVELKESQNGAKEVDAKAKKEIQTQKESYQSKEEVLKKKKEHALEMKEVKGEKPDHAIVKGEGHEQIIKDEARPRDGHGHDSSIKEERLQHQQERSVAASKRQEQMGSKLEAADRRLEEKLSNNEISKADYMIKKQQITDARAKMEELQNQEMIHREKVVKQSKQMREESVK